MRPPIPEDVARIAAAGTPLPVLTTSRLVIRPWVDTDRAAFAAMNADPEVAEFLGGVITRAASDAMIDTMIAGGVSTGLAPLAMEDRHDGRFLGMVGLWVPTWTMPFTPCVEIAWRLARDAWGQGLAREGAEAMLAWGFGPLGLPRILSWTAEGNVRSWGLMARLGMERVGTFDHPKLGPEHPLRRHVMYALERSAWLGRAED